MRSGYALVLSTAATGILGVAYWTVAARGYPTKVVGEASATISAILMLSNFAQMNLYFGLTRFIPMAGRRTSRLIAGAYAASCGLALVLATLYVTVVPSVAPGLSVLRDGALAGIAFVAAVLAWNVFALQDAVLAALRRSAWVPIENAIFGVVKLVLLVAFAGTFVEGGIFASWNLPVVATVVCVNVLIFRRLVPLHQTGPASTDPSLREIRRFVALDYVSSLFLQIYTTALPVVIVGLLGAEANAAFYVAYVIVSTLDLVAVNLSTSLIVESAHDEARLGEFTRRVLRRTGALVFLAVAFLVVSAPLLLVVFGKHYSGDASTVLRLLALGSLPRIVGIVYMSAMRVQRRVGRVVAVQASTSAVIMTLTLVLAPSLGLEGVGIAWVAGHGAVAIALLPWLRRTVQGGGSG